MNVLKIENLTKRYFAQIIFSNITFSFDNKYIYFLTSPNGAGKTTFFRCLLRETKYEGKIFDNNISYCFLPEKGLLPDLTSVSTFLETFLINDEKITYYLDRYGILKYKNYKLGKLSKGTKQKVLIIKTLLSEGDVYLFDEPFNGLDHKSRSILCSDIDLLRNKGKLVLIATHYFDEYNLIDKQLFCI